MDCDEFYLLLRNAERDCLWGEISFSFRDGKLTFIRTTKTEEPQRAIPVTEPLRRREEEHDRR